MSYRLVSQFLFDALFAFYCFNAKYKKVTNFLFVYEKFMDFDGCHAREVLLRLWLDCQNSKIDIVNIKLYTHRMLKNLSSYFCILATMAMPVHANSQDSDFIIMDPAYSGHDGSQLDGLNAYIDAENRLADICDIVSQDAERNYLDTFCNSVGDTIEEKFPCIAWEQGIGLLRFSSDLAEESPSMLHDEIECALGRATHIYDILLHHDYTTRECETLPHYSCARITYPFEGDYKTVTYAFSLEP